MLMDPRHLIIDSFAGGGGASTGIELALGRSPDIAINHSAAALALHAANHPDTLHLDSNIWDVDPRTVCAGRKVGLLWASPDCKHFSKAKGAALRDRNIRDLAWVLVPWAEEVRPDVILMENVEEFKTWGPIDNDGRPIKEFSGVTFELWVKRLRKAGYKIQWRELRACDYGAPTIRKRFFMIARCDGRPIVWPKPTHGDPRSAAVKRGKLLPWRTAAEIIDWSLPCPSIFATSEEIMAEHGVRAIRPLADNTMARVARGMQRYVLEAQWPYLVNLTHGGRVEGADEPFRTITGANRGEKAVVAPSLMSMKGTARRDSAATAPHPTVLAGGGHSALIAPSITRFNGGATGSDMGDPVGTVTANSWVKKPGGATPLGMIAPVLTYAQQGGRCRSMLDPHHTITASKKDQNSLIAATMIQTGYGEREGQAPRALDIHRPLGTIVTGNAKRAAVAAFLAQQNGGPRMEAHCGHDVGNPISTLAGKGSHQTPVAAFIAREFGSGTGQAADQPSATITAGGGGHSKLAAAWLAKWYSTDQDPRLTDPLHTVTTKARFDVENATIAAPPFSAEHEERARRVADFMRAHGAWDDREFVSLVIDGDTFIVVDIGMRMLTPRELFNAQGFPRDYVIEGVWDEGAGWENIGHNGGPTFHPFPKSVQISCCGNSVCPDVAKALVAANCTHLVEQQMEAAHAGA